uniref:GP-PDE domain-containing protein n=1 Tax=Globodera pallida TaxID=36090 RepID=A0A183CPG4_GLOPA
MECWRAVHPSTSSSVWRSSIELDGKGSQCLLRFRFFVGLRLQTDPSNAQSPISLSVVRWEAQKSPRCILPSVEANLLGECNKGVINEFGIYGGRDRLVMDGWINGREQRQIFLRLFGTALRFFDNKLLQRNFLIRVTPCDVRMDQEFNFASPKGLVSWRTPSLYIHSLDSTTEEDEQYTAAATSTATHIPLPSHSCTEFANLLSDANPFFREQSEHGEPFRNDGEDYFVFRTTSVATEFLAFRVELFMLPQRNWSSGETKVGLSPSRFALAYCMPSSMPDTNGSISLPLVAVKTQKPVGQIKMDYLLATSVDWGEEEDHATRMEATYVKHWKKRRTLEVGHRGSGESFTKWTNFLLSFPNRSFRFATARENTIFSLNNAAQKGADFVEFDVQLSRDQSVVVFHDFHVLVSVAKRNPQRLEPNGLTTTNNSIKLATEVGGPTAAATTDGGELHKMAVRDLSLAQLRLLHVHHYLEAEERDKISHPPHKHHHLTGEPDEGSDFRSFPTLVEALQRVDEHAGFNVEIKYPMKMRDGTHECENYFERNQYMDRLLMDVFGHAGKRRVVFSSFDPDICTLLSVKQNRYPVLFLCVGQTDSHNASVCLASCTAALARTSSLDAALTSCLKIKAII